MTYLVLMVVGAACNVGLAIHTIRRARRWLMLNLILEELCLNALRLRGWSLHEVVIDDNRKVIVPSYRGPRSPRSPR